MNCPGFEKLLDYTDGLLAGETASDFAAHLAAGCLGCEADRAWYEQMRLVASSDDSVEPPAWILKRAIRVFDARGARSRVARAANLVASLLFDGVQRPAPAGARSSSIE